MGLIRILAAGIAVLVLVGCASHGDYFASVDAANARQVEMARAQSEADAVRYQALMRIAESGDATAKVAAAMALALGAQSRAAPMIAPQMPQNEALQWASILVPGVTQLGLAHFSAQTAINASNNARDLGLSANSTMLGLGQGIQAGSTHGYQYINPTPVIAPDPVVVTQPPPLVVEQPAPIVVNPVIVPQAAP